MKLYYPITVDLYQPYPLPIMEAQQNNIGRGALVTLTAQGAVITPTGESIQLYAKKPDGTISYLACTLTGSQIECDFTNQMLALPGMVRVELQMIGGESGAETEITTPIFCVKVNPSNVDDSAIESQDEFPALVDALAEVEDLKKNGLKGDAATVTVGSTTTGDPGTDAAVSNSGTTGDAVLNFTIPRGADGSMWYYGDAITGNSTSGTVFAESGITSANMGDKYLNTSSGADKGNVYTCAVAGDAETAQWVYIGNIEGPQGPEGPAGMQEITFGARSTYPTTGNTNMLYVDNTLSPAVFYLFNTGLNQYIPINQGSVEFTGSGTTILMQSQQVPKSFRSLKVYGKSTQNGAPSPESPAPIVGAGDEGEINISVSDGGTQLQTLTLSTPNGLPGIPVKSGGNYTDESGQQWIADVKDYGTGKYTQNVQKVVLDGSEDEDWVAENTTIRERYSLRLQPEAKISDTTNGATSMNSNLPLGRKGGTYSIPNIYTIAESAESSQLFVSLNGTETLSEFKQYLQQSPMTVLYQLATPIVTDISAEEMEAYNALKTYTPTTVISSDSGVWMKADLVDSDILYPHAENTSYDNSTSGLTADNVQEAIDENAEAIGALNSRTEYVEAEVPIGTWVNGKTIYRKCVLNNVYVNESTSISLPDVDELISVKGSGINVGGTYRLPVPYSDIDGSSIYAYGHTAQSNFTFDVYLAGKKSNGYFTVFFEYTKS